MAGGNLVKVNPRDWAPARDGVNDSVFLGIAVVVIVLLGLGGWAVVARIDGAVVAAGQLAVEGNRKTVQHYEGGIVKEIRVAEGDTVRAGDTLVVLDDTVPRAELALLEKQIFELLARGARLVAERDGAAAIPFPEGLLQRAHAPAIAELLAGQKAVFETRRTRLKTEVALLRERQAQLREEIAGLGGQRKAVAQQISIIGKELRTAKALLAKGLTHAMRVNRLARDAEEKRGEAAALAAQVAAATGKNNETDLEILRLRQRLQEEVAGELRAVEAELNALSERRLTSADRLRRTRIAAPRGGIVLNLAVHNVGQVLSSGERLMEIVPANDQLVVKAHIRPEDVDKVKVGAPAELMLSAFNRRTTPRLWSRVAHVSPDQMESRPGEMPHFQAVLTIPPEQAARLGDLTLMPGMPVEVFIRTGERVVLSYFLKPLTDRMNRAFRED